MCLFFLIDEDFSISALSYSYVFPEGFWYFYASLIVA